MENLYFILGLAFVCLVILKNKMDRQHLGEYLGPGSGGDCTSDYDCRDMSPARNKFCGPPKCASCSGIPFFNYKCTDCVQRCGTA